LDAVAASGAVVEWVAVVAVVVSVAADASADLTCRAYGR